MRVDEPALHRGRHIAVGRVHNRTLRAGADSMLLAFARAGAKSGSGRVRVVIDYASLAKAYGGGFGSRLSALPGSGCVLVDNPNLTEAVARQLLQAQESLYERVVDRAPGGAR
jgi:hypothetical protein